MQAGKKVPDGRAHRRNRLAGVGSGFLDCKLNLAGTGLHLRLGRYVPYRFICGGAQLALTLGHAANVTRRGFDSDGFFFRPLAGQIRPTARALLCIGQRAAPGLLRADTALTGGVGVGGFSLLCGMAFSVLFYLLAGKLAALLYGEIGVLFDSRIGCVSQRRARVLGCGVVAILLRGGAFPQLGSAFLLGFCPRLFSAAFGIFPDTLLFGIRSAGFSLTSVFFLGNYEKISLY